MTFRYALCMSSVELGCDLGCFRTSILMYLSMVIVNKAEKDISNSPDSGLVMCVQVDY